MTDWSHPRIANPACRIHDSDDIAAEARAAFERRRDTYPGLVKAGRITAEEARADLEAWRAIARDWKWIALGEGEPAGPWSLAARTAALDTAIARWLEMAGQNGGRLTEAENAQGALLCAMRWWTAREGSGSRFEHIRFIAGAGHSWRHDNGHPTRGAILTVRKAQAERTAA
jgi:hypothetical protein